MSEPKQPREAWAEVGRQFEELGRALGDRFSRPDAATWKSEEPPAAGERDDRRALMDALRKVGDAAQQFGDQAGEAVRDPELRETAKSATRGLADALETTFGQLAAQLRRTGESRPGSAPDPDAWSRAADPDAPRALVDPVRPAAPAAGAAEASADSGIADAGAPTSGAVEDPEATPGPDPDPAPGDSPDPDQVPTRPPSDS